MPKKGGKRSKKRTSTGPSKGVRLCEEDGEQYGVVTQMLGGPNCRVTCQDGTERMCVIRSKFRWRNKNHNRLSAGTWVMVGVREWERVRGCWGARVSIYVWFKTCILQPTLHTY